MFVEGDTADVPNSEGVESGERLAMHNEHAKDISLLKE